MCLCLLSLYSHVFVLLSFPIWPLSNKFPQKSVSLALKEIHIRWYQSFSTVVKIEIARKARCSLSTFLSSKISSRGRMLIVVKQLHHRPTSRTSITCRCDYGRTPHGRKSGEGGKHSLPGDAGDHEMRILTIDLYSIRLDKCWRACYFVFRVFPPGLI